MKHSKLFNEVDSIMTKQIKKNQDVINNSKIEHLANNQHLIKHLVEVLGIG